MHNADSFLENVAHKGIWDFEIQTDPLISTRRPDLALSKMRKENVMDFAALTDHWEEINERQKIDKYLDLARELKKTI